MYDFVKCIFLLQPESDGSRSGSSLSCNIPAATPAGNAQSPLHGHRGVHRSISATNPKPNRRASSGGETLREAGQPGAAPAAAGGGGPTLEFTVSGCLLFQCAFVVFCLTPVVAFPIFYFFNNKLYVVHHIEKISIDEFIGPLEVYKKIILT